MTTIKNEGKRACLNKIFIKLHIFHEMKFVVDIFERIYTIIKYLIQTIYNFVIIELKLAFGIFIDIIKLIMVISIRLINLFRRKEQEETIELDYDDEDEEEE